MAQTRKKSSSSRKKRKSSSVAQAESVRPAGNVFCGMLVGVGIVLVLVLLFLVPFNGKTLFSHFLGLFPDEPEVSQTKMESATTSVESKATKTEAVPTVAAGAQKAMPLEELSASDEDSLDKLIDSKR